MRDLPPTRDLLELARRLLLDDIAPLVPPERRRDVHLAATAIAIALRESGTDGGPARELAALLRDFYATEDRDVAPPRTGEPDAGGLDGLDAGGMDAAEMNAGGTAPRLIPLLARLAADLRKGAFETMGSRERAARAILWRLTFLKLREANPGFLAANGFDTAE